MCQRNSDLLKLSLDEQAALDGFETLARTRARSRSDFIAIVE